VAELAAAVGVSADTIRYYEKAGLLPAPARTASGYRAYETSMVERLRFVQGAQRLGLRLKDIADLLTVRDTGKCPCEPAEQLLRRRLAEVDIEITRLVALRGQMAAMLAALPDTQECPPLPEGTWCPPVQARDENGKEVIPLVLTPPVSQIPADPGCCEENCCDASTSDSCTCQGGCC
jgi:DNA-binding transcriptional MerR regulator